MNNSSKIAISISTGAFALSITNNTSLAIFCITFFAIIVVIGIVCVKCKAHINVDVNLTKEKTGLIQPPHKDKPVK
ncbi:hypothetical protein [Clostridium mediterraneense]|uniref:hypothetical protein n=1 Tax=Clostridium mediterraneense TaxID=1805472 RepID=UPI00083709CC|nr:hypothetical protein [Clostridium mediterraneense]